MTEYNQLIQKLSDSIKITSSIENELFKKHNVKRGLRNEDHTGVLVGLTKIGEVLGYEKNADGTLTPIDGNLFYRGISVLDLVERFRAKGRHGYEDVVYLLLSGNLPTDEELEWFHRYLADQRHLCSMSKMSILDLHGNDIMNILARSVMVLYTEDQYAEDTSQENLMKQSLNLVAKFPTIIAYAYHAMRHHYQKRTLSLRHPKEDLGTAENFLYMLKGTGNYTELDTAVLDLAMVLHAEHGGGNNSTFTIRVTSSSGTDTYSAVTAAIGSLKGPLHGGANLRVMSMFEHLKDVITDWKDREEIAAYLLRMLNKEVYNKTGLIYGIGHAVYTLSDPRAVLLKKVARQLAEEKGRLDEFEFLDTIEGTGIDVFTRHKGEEARKIVCANVDLYSGFVYSLIGIPKELFTPMFAMARIAGWAAHRIEELNFESRRIIRPAYMNVCDRVPSDLVLSDSNSIVDAKEVKKTVAQ